MESTLKHTKTLNNIYYVEITISIWEFTRSTERERVKVFTITLHEMTWYRDRDAMTPREISHDQKSVDF